MRPRHRAVVVAVSPLGTIAGHVVGYRLAGHGASLDGSHAHLRPGAWLAVALAVAALAWVAVSGRGGRTRASLTLLASGQLASFVVLEAAEQLVGGHGVGHLPGDPSFRWGLAAQVVAAAVLVLAVGVARATGERVRAVMTSGKPSVTIGATPPPFRPIATPALRSLTVATAVSERGPPRLLVPV